MNYNKRPFKQRLGVLGDEAEGVYEQAHPLGRTERWGWRRPENVSVNAMSDVIRHKPDYYADSGYLVEVMGCGRDSVLKSMKVSKYEALKVWKKFCKMAGLNDLVLFVWNSHEEQYVIIGWSDLVELVAKSKRKHGVRAFEDGNEYYPIDWEWLTEKAAWVGQWTTG